MADEQRGAAWPTYGLDQIAVEAWVRRTWGDGVTDNPLERGKRVLEEGIEVAQAIGVPKEDALAILEEVYRKPVGELDQEIGGLGVTTLALCAHREVRLDDLTKREIDRVLSKDREELRKRQAAKADLGLADRPE